ncbi:MAG TPA: ATP-binding protein [Gaiellaceae bacterium]|nr:ATP-binding protein [Gaiellaceae bacterium]
MKTGSPEPARTGALSPIGAADVLAATLAGAQAALACWEMTADGDLLLVAANDRYREFIGRPGEDLVGKPLREVYPAIQDESVTLMRHVVSSGEPFQLERYASRNEDGDVTYWDLVLMPVKGSGPARLVLSAQDVTQRAESAENLEAQNRWLRERTERESVRLQALARIARAAQGGGFDAILTAVAEGVKAAFGLDTVINVLDPDRDVYVVRAGSGGGVDRLVGTENSRAVFEEFLDARYEVIPDVYFISHEAMHPTWGKLGDNVVMPVFEWSGAGWHPEDACFIRLRTTEGKDLGILSVDSPVEQPIPDRSGFELLRLFAAVGANATENVTLLGEIGSLEAERQMQTLRKELEEEVALHRSLLEIGNRLGLASAAASVEILPLIVERLGEVVPIQSATISRVDHALQSIRPIYHSQAGPVADAMLRFEIPFGVGATGVAVLQRRSVIANAGEPDGAIAVDVPGTAQDDEHVLAVPVLVDERVRAGLTLHRPGGEPPFTPEDARRAEMYGQYIMSVLLLLELAETGRELSESRRALSEQVEQLESLNRMKDEFVANVSHELRTPLTAVIGNVATVARSGDVLRPEERHDLLDAAERQAKRLAELLENLLATSRLADNAPAIAPLRVDLPSFVEEVASALRSRAPQRTVEVESPSRVELVTDPTLLYRILFNLGDNALKYSDHEVRFVIESDDEEARISVRDRGIGIAPEDVPRVFERFQQLDPSHTRRVGGVGLGLYLSDRAARALGGRIDVDSRPGEGSTFTLRVPRSAVAVD